MGCHIWTFKKIKSIEDYDLTKNILKKGIIKALKSAIYTKKIIFDKEIRKEKNKETLKIIKDFFQIKKLNQNEILNYYNYYLSNCLDFIYEIYNNNFYVFLNEFYDMFRFEECWEYEDKIITKKNWLEFKNSVTFTYYDERKVELFWDLFSDGIITFG